MGVLGIRKRTFCHRDPMKADRRSACAQYVSFVGNQPRQSGAQKITGHSVIAEQWRAVPAVCEDADAASQTGQPCQ